MNHPLASFIKRFFSHYLPVQKGLSVNTILAYRDAVKLLLCHAADTVKKPPNQKRWMIHLPQCCRPGVRQ